MDEGVKVLRRVDELASAQLDVPLGALGTDETRPSPELAAPRHERDYIAPPPPPALELRVEVLEKAVTELQDTSVMEERVFQRVLGRMPAPAAPRTTTWLSRLNPFRSPKSEVPLPVASGWLVWDMLTEARFLTSMIFDSRFSMTWASKLGVILCLTLIATAQWWFPLSWFPFIGTWVDKLMTLVLAFFLFKMLSRETQRYRAFLKNES